MVPRLPDGTTAWPAEVRQRPNFVKHIFHRASSELTPRPKCPPEIALLLQTRTDWELPAEEWYGLSHARRARPKLRNDQVRTKQPPWKETSDRQEKGFDTDAVCQDCQVQYIFTRWEKRDGHTHKCRLAASNSALLQPRTSKLARNRGAMPRRNPVALQDSMPGHLVTHNTENAHITPGHISCRTRDGTKELGRNTVPTSDSSIIFTVWHYSSNSAGILLNFCHTKIKRPPKLT